MVLSLPPSITACQRAGSIQSRHSGVIVQEVFGFVQQKNLSGAEGSTNAATTRAHRCQSVIAAARTVLPFDVLPLVVPRFGRIQRTTFHVDGSSCAEFQA